MIDSVNCVIRLNRWWLENKKTKFYYILNLVFRSEERHLYAPVMEYDDGLDLSRHAIAEHHEMDEMMHKLNDGRISDDTWKETCHALIHELRHKRSFLSKLKNYRMKNSKKD